MDLSMFTLLSASTYVTLFSEPRIACFPINCLHVDARNEQSSRFERASWTPFLLATCLFIPCAILFVTSHFAWYHLRSVTLVAFMLFTSARLLVFVQPRLVAHGVMTVLLLSVLSRSMKYGWFFILSGTFRVSFSLAILISVDYIVGFIMSLNWLTKRDMRMRNRCKHNHRVPRYIRHRFNRPRVCDPNARLSRSDRWLLQCKLGEFRISRS